MAEQTEKKRFTVSLYYTSYTQDERCYSIPFSFAGYIWRLLTFPKGNRSDGYMSLYLQLANSASLPSGWQREVKYSLTLVNKGQGKSNQSLGGKCLFDVKNNGWGRKKFVSLTKLFDKDEGFVVDNKLTILAELDVLPAIVLPVADPLSSKGGNQASDASVSKSQGDSSGQVAQKTEIASKEDLDEDDQSEEGSDDDDASEVGSDDDATYEEGSNDDDDGSEEDANDDDDDRPYSEPSSDASHIEGNHGARCNSVAAETEVSNSENDDAPKDNVDDEASSHVSNDSAINGSSLNQDKSLEDASQTVENGGRGLNTKASVTGTSEKMLMEIQRGKETMDVINGFEVFSSQVESVSHIFKRHPDIAIGFRPKNQHIRRAYMDSLLSLIEMMCQSPEKLSENDLSNAQDTLVDLTDAGFKLDWLETKLDEICKKKKMEQGSKARLQTMEEQLQKLKEMFLDLESQLHKEKVEALAARAPLSFNDVVC